MPEAGLKDLRESAEMTEMKAKISKLESELEAERNARLLRHRQQCETQAELEGILQMNDELKSQLSDLTLDMAAHKQSFEDLQSQSEIPTRMESLASRETAGMESKGNELLMQLEKSRDAVNVLREQLQAAEAKLEAIPRRVDQNGTGESKGPSEGASVESANSDLGALRDLLTERELDLKNLTEQLSGKFYGVRGLVKVTPYSKKGSAREHNTSLVGTAKKVVRKFVAPNVLVALCAFVVAIGSPETLPITPT